MSISARWLAGVLVAVLAIVTIVLVVLAVQRTRATFPNETPAPVPSFTFQPAPGDSPRPQPVETNTPAATPAPTADAAAQRFLAAGSGTLWRATAGACGGAAPLIERSDDGGDTWSDVTPVYRQIAQVLSLDPFADGQAEAVAAMGTACEVEALRTFTQGEFWAPYDDVLAASRYVAPGEPAVIVTPAGDVEAPCASPTSFRASGDVVALVCDGVASWLDGGRWTPLEPQGVVALAVADGAVLTASTAEGCSGAAVTRSTPGGASEPVGCAPDLDLGTPLAMAASGPDVLVWSGDAITTLG